MTDGERASLTPREGQFAQQLDRACAIREQLVARLDDTEQPYRLVLHEPDGTTSAARVDVSLHHAIVAVITSRYADLQEAGLERVAAGIVAGTYRTKRKR
jgi:hypothetical protein